MQKFQKLLLKSRENRLNVYGSDLKLLEKLQQYAGYRTVENNNIVSPESDKMRVPNNEVNP